MADKVIVTKNKLDALANSISAKSGESLPMTIAEMKDAVDGIQTGGGAITPTLQSKTATPTESQQTINPDSGYDGLSSVTVNAISNTYVGSQVARKSSTDLTVSGATITAPAGYYEESASKSVASGSASTPATTITANPSISVNTTTGLITANVSGSKSVTPTVSAGYVSSGTAGTVSVSGSNTSQLSTQAGSTITPTETEQTAVDANKYTLGTVKVGAISSTYVGSGIDRNDSTDLTASGATVTVPAGYYEEDASKSVASGSTGTPTATKGAVSNHQVSITPSVTNTTGYITGGTKTGTALTVTASELASGNKEITANGTEIDVVGYSTVSVAVPADTPNLQTKTGIAPSTSSQTITADSDYDGLSSVQINAMPSGTAGTPSANKGAVSNHSISITPSVTNTTGYITGGTKTGTAVTVTASELASGNKAISANGTDIDVVGYSTVSVAVPSEEPNLQAKTGITPTESTQTITADTDYDGLSSVQINAIPSTYVGSGITSRSSSDLTVSGATVTTPAGYYEASSSKSVASGSTGTPTASKGSVSNHSISITPSVTNTTGYITGETKTGTAVTVTASELASGNKSIVDNGTGIDVVGYSTVSVAVPFSTITISSSSPSGGSNGDIWIETN